MNHLIVGARYRIEGCETIGTLTGLEWDPIQRVEYGHIVAEDGRNLRIETRSLLGPRTFSEAVDQLKLNSVNR